jgi:hypothetical protein
MGCRHAPRRDQGEVLSKLLVVEPGLGLHLKQLDEENRRLKKLVADLSLDKEMLQDVIRRKL